MTKRGEFRQFGHGYAVTSHSAQGPTANRVTAHIDTESPRSLINNRLPYVAISRASDDARIYTNDAGNLGEKLKTDITKTAALPVSEKGIDSSINLPLTKTPGGTAGVPPKLPVLDQDTYGLSL